MVFHIAAEAVDQPHRAAMWELLHARPCCWLGNRVQVLAARQRGAQRSGFVNTCGLWCIAAMPERVPAEKTFLKLRLEALPGLMVTCQALRLIHKLLQQGCKLWLLLHRLPPVHRVLEKLSHLQKTASIPCNRSAHRVLDRLLALWRCFVGEPNWLRLPVAFSCWGSWAPRSGCSE